MSGSSSQQSDQASPSAVESRDDPRVDHRTSATRSRADELRSSRPAQPDDAIDVAPGRSWAMERKLIRRLFGWLGNPPIDVALWDGTLITAPGEQPAEARVVIRDRRTLWGLIRRPMLHFGDAYCEGHIEIEGDLLRLLAIVYRHRDQHAGPESAFRRWLKRWARKARSNTLRGSRKNIHHHYDIGNDFYQLWLDEAMVYTCAYFPEPDLSLEDAQFAKMDHVCRKLRLKPGETVVEAGCGWGALALHMAKHYGVNVKAYNISDEQIAWAQEQAARGEYAGRVEFIKDDYRNVAGQYDVFVSVGMLEHVGVDHYRELGATIDRCLKPDGRGLLHSIGQDRPGTLNPWIDRRIFPGAYPPSLREMLGVLEPWSLSVIDVENLRLHYARTLRHWLERFEKTRDQTLRMFDERFVRMWRLYLSGSIAAFDTGALQLFQVVFTRHGLNDIPWTRADLYA